MRFLEPRWLLALLAVAALAAGYLVAARRRGRYAVRFTQVGLLASVAPRRPGWRRHVAAAAFLLALATLGMALARPAADVRVPRERATVILALDVSLSMEATDVAPSRLVAAQRAAKAFVAQLPPTFNVGLVSFAGTATVAVSPTRDRAAVQRGIDGLTLAEATATGEAIFAALGAIRQVPADGANGPPPARIVLMSDGFRTVGRPNSLAEQAAVEAKVPVSTIAFGTDSGTVSVQGQQVPVPVDRSALQAIAAATGGRYYAAASESALRAVYTDLGSSIGWRTVPREVTRWFAGAALLLGLLAGALSLLWTSRLP